ncbi:lipase [Paraconexibacter sp. AEG42_29]|uniref:Lipase n=1 Tax=Paraconexibacter sp. AEG42_29 TaxID=2997339 RepID=A0AAU7AQ70_9ACTN
MRRAASVLAACVLLALAPAGCGSDNEGDSGAPGVVATGPASSVPATRVPGVSGNVPVNPTPRPRSGTVAVAALGDSITAGTPLYDPDPDVRKQIGDDLDERSQWEYWFTAAHPRYEIRNCGVNGERTDEIARRLQTCAAGAKVLVVQGGINDIAQGRSVEDAARNLRVMYAAGKKLGLDVYGVEVLPWNNGYPQAAPLVTRLNTLLRAAAKAEGVTVFPWYAALEDPENRGRMRAELTIEGNHPTVAGYKKLAEAMELP